MLGKIQLLLFGFSAVGAKELIEVDVPATTAFRTSDQLDYVQEQLIWDVCPKWNE